MVAGVEKGGEPVRLISYQFQPETLIDSEHGPYVEVDEIADLHYGSRFFLLKKAMQHREYILANPERKVIDVGDHYENSLRSSPGAAIFEQTCSPREQRAWVKEYCRPMRDRFLAVTAGNHEDRSARDSDIEADEMLVDFLGCPWIRWEAILSITVGDSRHGQNYTIYVRHAVSNSTKTNVIMGAMFQRAKTAQGCDVYLFAHNHTFIYESLPCFMPDPRHGKVREKLQHFCMGDSFLNYEGSYAEQHGYALPNPGQVALRLYQNKHLVEVKRLLY